MEGRVRARLTPSEGRRFAFPVGLAFLALAGVLWWRERLTLALGAASLGGLLLVAGLLVPGKLGPVYRAWMALAAAISRVTTPIFLGIVYFLVMTPIGLVRRVLGGNPVVQEPNAGSYWKKRDKGKRKGNLERQF